MSKRKLLKEMERIMRRFDAAMTNLNASAVAIAAIIAGEPTANPPGSEVVLSTDLDALEKVTADLTKIAGGTPAPTPTPTPAPPAGGLSITGVSPTSGKAGDQVDITGTGFNSDTVFTFNGVKADVGGMSGGTLAHVTAPAQAVVPVNEVAILAANPDGSQATALHGFTYSV